MPKVNVKEIEDAIEQAFGEESIELVVGGEAIATKDRWLSDPPFPRGDSPELKLLDLLKRQKVGNVIVFAAGTEMVLSVQESPDTWTFESEAEKEKAKAVMLFFANSLGWIKSLLAENKELRDQRDFLLLDSRSPKHGVA